MDLASYRKTERRITQGDCAIELKLGGKGTISALESGSYKASVETALRIYKWSGQRVDPKTLVHPEKAHLLADLPVFDGA
jgi:DNA-binding XRE family transcriptional regulator